MQIILGHVRQLRPRIQPIHAPTACDAFLTSFLHGIGSLYPATLAAIPKRLKRALFMKPTNVALILDLAQAIAWSKSSTSTDLIISFSPDATIFLNETHKNVKEIEDLIPAFSHARNIVFLDKILNSVDDQLRAMSLHPSEVESLRIFLFNFVPPLLLLRSVVKACPVDSYAVVIDGQIKVLPSAEKVISCLADELHPDLAQFTNTDYSRFHGYVVRVLNRLIVPFLRNRTTIYHLDFGNPVPRKVSDILSAYDQQAAVVYVRAPRKTILDSIVRGVKTIIRCARGGRGRNEIHMFRAAVSKSRKAVDRPALSALAFGDALLDVPIRKAVQQHARIVHMEVEAGAELAKAQKATVVLLDSIIFPATIRAAMEFRQQGSRVVLINHGTHTAPTDRISALASRVWAGQGRVTNRAATDLVCKTPSTADVANELSDHRPVIHALPIFQPIARSRRTTAAFTILVAGNFMGVRQHVPWLTETPGEYLRGILDFAEAVAEVPETRLIIKMKPKKDGIPVDWLRDRLSDRRYGGRIRIDLDSPMGVLLPETDLLVANLSSTIEEALACRIPVFLNTWRRRYWHFPARFTVPTAESRAAVYGAKPGQDIATMLRGIKAAHMTPLSDDELKGLVWITDSEKAHGDFAKSILG